MSASIKVEGLNRLVRDVVGLGVEVQDLKSVFGSLADRGAQLAASFAPRRSGALAASIRGNKAKNKAVILGGKARTPYAGPINYGWPKRNIRPALFMQRADTALSKTAAADIDAELTRLIRDLGLS